MKLMLLGVFLLIARPVALHGEKEQEEICVTGLVGGHLDQASHIESSASRIGITRDPLTHSFGSLTDSWHRRLDDLPRESQLLVRIPEEIWDWIEPISQNEAELGRVLEKPVDLLVLLALIALRDPQIRSSYAALRATVNRLPQASFLNDLLVRYRAFLRETDTLVGLQAHKESLQSAYPFPAGLTIRGEIAELQIELARLEYESVLRQRLNGAARDYFELVFTDRSIEIMEENRALVAEMESVAIAQLRVGRASQADALRAQTMLDFLEDSLYALEQQRQVIVARICSSLLLRKTFLRKTAESELSGPSADQSELLKQAQEKSQLLASARRRLELLEASTKLVETSLPLASSPASRIDLNKGAEAGPTRNTQATFPLKTTPKQGVSQVGQNLAYLEELRLRLIELRQKVRSSEAEVEFQVRAALARHGASQNRIQTFNELVVPKLERVFDTTLEQYNTSRVSFIELADAGREYLDALVDQERSLYERRVNLIDLQDSIGRTALDLLLSGMEE